MDALQVSEAEVVLGRGPVFGELVAGVDGRGGLEGGYGPVQVLPPIALEVRIGGAQVVLGQSPVFGGGVAGKDGQGGLEGGYGPLQVLRLLAPNAVSVGGTQTVLRPSPSLRGRRRGCRRSGRPGRRLWPAPNSRPALPERGHGRHAQVVLGSGPVFGEFVAGKDGQGGLEGGYGPLQVLPPIALEVRIGGAQVVLGQSPVFGGGVAGKDGQGGLEGGYGPLQVLPPVAPNAVRVGGGSRLTCIRAQCSGEASRV